jgi:hypothetical protein
LLLAVPAPWETDHKLMMALARHLLHLRGNSANASHACNDRIILMHVGRSSVPLCWVGCGAPHQAVILLNACWEAGCTGVPITKHRLGAGFAASNIVPCQRSPLEPSRESEVHFRSIEWYAVLGSTIGPLSSRRVNQDGIIRDGTRRGTARGSQSCC